MWVAPKEQELIATLKNDDLIIYRPWDRRGDIISLPPFTLTITADVIPHINLALHVQQVSSRVISSDSVWLFKKKKKKSC